jgi:hypothetical protein
MSLIRILQMARLDFDDWGLTNFKEGYRWLTKPGEQPNIVANGAVKDQDFALYARCHAFLGKRKSSASVRMTGRQAFQNGAGCCTTSAFAAAFKLLSFNIPERIEIIGQSSHDNGHMWVVVGRTGGTVQDGNVKRPANDPDQWGNIIVVDTWLKAFGWSGVWKNPPGGAHHEFIENDSDFLEVTYDSLVPNGDP